MQEDTHVCVSESLINYNPDSKINREGVNPVTSDALKIEPTTVVKLITEFGSIFNASDVT